MKRQLIACGLVVFALFLFILIAVSMAAPGSGPLRQVPENEPNNSCSEAEEIGLASPVIGSISSITDTDWFSVTTTMGDPYIASASIGPADFRVRLCVYADAGGSCALIGCSSASDSYAEESWDATGSLQFIKVERFESITNTTYTADYLLEVVAEYVPPATDTPTSTPPPSVSGADAYEDYYAPYTDNNVMARAYTLPVATSLTLSGHQGLANFHTLDADPPGRDQDWYAFWGKEDNWYQVKTSNLIGVDTHLEVWDRNGSRLSSNDDGGDGYASLTSFQAPYNGYYYIRVRNKVDTTGTYDMSVDEVGPPAEQPTPTPGPGPQAGADDCEDNGDFDQACVIAPNDPQTFNFIPPYGGADNDFFKIWIKPGFLYECATSFLDAGVDPNMIVYTGPSWDNAIGGNDDVEPGDLNSYFSYYATYDGWLYLLVGYGDRTPSDVNNSNYTLECKMSTPGEPTSTPRPTGAATAVPQATARPPTAVPIPTEAGLTVRPLATPTAIPGDGGGSPEPRYVRVRAIVYYDANGDNEAGAGEGVADISIKAYDAMTNELLTQDFTDTQGYREFTISAQGPIRVSVPFFGFSQLVSGEEEEVTIRLRVPFQSLPGGES